MKFENNVLITTALFLIILLTAGACNVPPPANAKNNLREKHNYIVLLDLSDRLIVQRNQPERDKQIVKYIYSLFEKKIKNELYIKSRDEMKVVIAPQAGAKLKVDDFEDRLYVNMNNVKKIFRQPKEAERRESFFNNLDTLYNNAVFSKNPKHYNGADIWKYFYEDLKVDYSKDTLTQNYLFILTDGYPIVGKNQSKLRDIKDEFPDLHIVMLEAAPRSKDMEWDRIMKIWEEWFSRIGIKKYTLIKRGAISKEMEQITELVTK